MKPSNQCPMTTMAGIMYLTRNLNRPEKKDL